MKFGVFGTGTVGVTIATKLHALGHEVMLGGRTAGKDSQLTFVKAHGARARSGTYADTAAFGEIVFNCTSGEGSLAALAAAGDVRLGDKILVDVSNPLDFSKGFPPSLLISNTDSLSEQLQRAHPRLKVVKTLNTVNAAVMTAPQNVANGDHDLFIAGDDAAAKRTVSELLQTFGWRAPIDLGDIKAARGMEAYLLLWVRLAGAMKTPSLNIRVMR
jgi:predicted dinucleotide-binding enzyme